MPRSKRKSQKKPKTETPVIYSQRSDPTPERILKTGGHYEVGDDKQGAQIITINDDQLHRLYANGSLNNSEYTALQKYRHHWYHSGQQPSLGSVDLNRIFAPDPFSMGGMAKSESQAHHRQVCRDANDELERKFGNADARIVIENVVCLDLPLQEGGLILGYQSPFRARERARGLLSGAARHLARHWGIG